SRATGDPSSPPNLFHDALAIDGDQGGRTSDSQDIRRDLPDIVYGEIEALQVLPGISDRLRQCGNQMDAFVVCHLREAPVEGPTLRAKVASALEHEHE